MPRGLVNARAKVGPLTLPRAVLIGAAIIASAILVVPMLAPYRFQAAMLGGFWQFNAVTGEARLCEAAGLVIVCGEAQHPDQRTLDRIR
jgi:hypothetical protein